jgi:hypothetical protein
MPATQSRIGLPDPASIIGETEFTPRRVATAEAAAAGARRAGLPARYRIITTNELDAYEAPLMPAEAEIFGLNRVRAPGDNFAGTARKAAKLSISNAPVQTFPDVSGVLAALPAKDPKNLSDDPKSGRIADEERNVRVRAFLYAASRESDNDFHLIVGDDPKQGTKVKMMTMEISGLPHKNSASFARLKSVRDAYKDFFKSDLPGFSYDFYDPPIPIEVEGSLFFDASHAHGTPPGPAKLRPHMPRIWELHPISKIVFEP